MDKLLYFEPMFSDRRERLINVCVELQKQGKSFIYILPSREAIRDVRYKFLEKLGGIINSQIIMFDELEKALTEVCINSSSIIFEDVEKLMLQRVCEKSKDKLKYFNKICTKNGFIEENKSFIKALKRNLISPEELGKKLESVTDPILKDKLIDLKLIYDHYTKELMDKEVYDINDISQIATMDKAVESSVLSEVDTLIIDGFINIDRVNIELIKKIASLNKLNIYVNCPYVNDLSRAFLEKEILNPFEKMDFKVLKDAEGFYETKPGFKELSEKYYSGEKIEESLTGITINKYPCIAAEVRETARSIKEKLINGEKAEDIAVFVNNKEEYSKSIHNVFKEFDIPLYMTYEIPLSSSQLGRELLNFIKGADMSSALGEEWIKLIKEKLQEKEPDMSMLAKEAFNLNLEYEDKLYLKSKDALEKLFGDIIKGFDLGEILRKEIDKQAFLNIYIDYLNGATVTLEKPINSGVKILNTDLAKGVYYKHVYVLGLNEGDIPKVIKNDGLFDELEIEKLKAIGLQYQDYLWEISREKIRFNLTLSSAKESLTLSYRSSEEDGSFTIASSLLDEVKYVGNIKDTNVVSMRERFSIPINKTMSSRELKVMNLRKLFENKYKGFDASNIDDAIGFLEGLEKNFNEMILSGIAEYHRGKEKDFSRFEGVLGNTFDETILDKKSFSPSKLNTYLGCPFKYMLQNLFDLGGIQEEETGVSNLVIGDLYHKVLFNYYDELNDFGALDEGRFYELFNKAFEDIKKLEPDEEELQKLEEDSSAKLKNFIVCDLKRINKYEAETKTIIRPFLLDEFIESKIFGETMTVKVDRVDLEYQLVGGEQVPTGRYIVYDYKKKKTSDINDFLNKENCQIAFYYYFVNEYLKEKLQMDDLDCMAILYLSIEGSNKSIKKNGLYRMEYKKALGFTGSSKFDMDKDMFYTFLEYLKGMIEDSIGNIKQGDFHYRLECTCFDDHGGKCDFKEVCRYNKSKMSVIGEA